MKTKFDTESYNFMDFIFPDAVCSNFITWTSNYKVKILRIQFPLETLDRIFKEKDHF